MQRLFSRFADLPMAAKLALLSGVAVLASLLIAYGGRTGLADLKSASDTEVELSRARASLHHLDTRNSELKVDAYRALSDDPEAVAGDVVDDVATVDEVLATLAGLELPADIRSAIDAVGEVNREFGAVIVEYVDLAQSDPDAALARIDEIADRNHELDDTLELIGEEVDADLAASVEERQSTFDSTNALLLLVLVGAVLVVGGLSVVISRSIMRRPRPEIGRAHV